MPVTVPCAPSGTPELGQILTTLSNRSKVAVISGSHRPSDALGLHRNCGSKCTIFVFLAEIFTLCFYEYKK